MRLASYPELHEAVRIFKELLMEVDTVICARTIPKHKAKLVKLVRSHNKVVLAIGDGANDVNMLTVKCIYSRKQTWVLVSMVRKECKPSKRVTSLLQVSSSCGSSFLFMGTGTIIEWPNLSTLSSTKTSSLLFHNSSSASSTSSLEAQSTMESNFSLQQLGNRL